jgi:hypothetical protein
MTKLLAILGRNIMSAQAAEVLAGYPLLHADAEDSAQEDVRYLRSERDGILIKLSGDGDIMAIFLMSEGKDGFAQYRGELPGRLDFASRPGDVLKRLGAPGFSRPAARLGSHETGELLRFDLPEYSIHFQFRPDRTGIELVTGVIAASVPGRSQAQPE